MAEGQSRMGCYGDCVVIPNHPKKGDYIYAGRPETGERYLCRVVEENRDYFRRDTLVSIVCMIQYPHFGNTVDCILKTCDIFHDGELVRLRYMGRASQAQIDGRLPWRESVIKCLEQYRENASHYDDSLRHKPYLTTSDKMKQRFADELRYWLDKQLEVMRGNSNGSD